MVLIVNVRKMLIKKRKGKDRYRGKISGREYIDGFHGNDFKLIEYMRESYGMDQPRTKVDISFT